MLRVYSCTIPDLIFFSPKYFIFLKGTVTLEERAIFVEIINGCLPVPLLLIITQLLFFFFSNYNFRRLKTKPRRKHTLSS